MARMTVAGCVERMDQLYGEGADEIRIGQYVRRRMLWASGDLAGLRLGVGLSNCLELSTLVERPFGAAGRHSPRQNRLTSTKR
jgi:hypothetical protein